MIEALFFGGLVLAFVAGIVWHANHIRWSAEDRKVWGSRPVGSTQPIAEPPSDGPPDEWKR